MTYDKPMTVGDLRKELEGLPGDMPVVHYDECWWRFVYSAKVAPTKPAGEHDLGDIDECERGEPGSEMFLIE